MSRATVYDKNTGKHLRTGALQDPKTQELQSQGHIIVNAAHNSMTMWDFGTSMVVPDADKEQEAIDHANRSSALKAKKIANKAALEASIGNVRSLPEVNDALDKIIEMLETL